jgi:hypothetical protein
MATYRKPTEKETEKLNKSREKMIQGIEGEKDIFSKMMPTMAKAARDDIRAAKAMRESVPAMAREGEAYQNAGYKKGGKVKHNKMKKYEGGGNVSESTREETRDAFKKRQEAKAEFEQMKKDRLASKVYNEKAAKYQKELELDPPNTNPVGYNIRKFEDKVGDKVRSVGKFFGSNKMTSLDDEAQMKARQDIKGYKAGGKVSSASKRADGCAIRGKTRA